MTTTTNPAAIALAERFDALLPEPVANLSGFDHGSRREVYEGGQSAMEIEADATLDECVRYLRDKGEDISWLTREARAILIAGRVEALRSWAESE